MSLNNKELLFFFFFSLLSGFFLKLILPFSDEPDFYVRFPDLLTNEKIFFYNYLIDFFAIEEFSNDRFDCSIVSSNTSFFSYYIGEQCFIKFRLYFFSVFISFLSTSFLYFIIFIQRFNYVCLKSELIFSICLSTLFPSFLYFNSLFSFESLQLTICVVSLLYLNKKYVIFFIFIPFIVFLDFGNSIVYVFFVINYYIINSLIRLKYNFIVVLYITFFLFVAFYFGLNFLKLFEFIPLIGKKISAIVYFLSEGSASLSVDKYPIFFRPVITITSLTFVSPSKVKSIILFILIVVVYFPFLLNLRKIISKINDKDISLILSMTFTIIFITFILPTYSYGKYYAFMIPILFLPLVYTYNKNSLILIFISFFYVFTFNISIFWVL